MIRNFHKRRKEFKLEAVRAVRDGKSVAEVAALCEVSERSVYAWCGKFGKQVKNEAPGTGEALLQPRKVVDEELKLAAVQEVLRGKPAVEVAKLCEVSKNTMYEWCAKYPKVLRKRGPVIGLEELLAKLTAADEERSKRRTEGIEAKQKETEVVAAAMAHPLTWMCGYSKTKDSHWQEAGALSPYRSLPTKQYFLPLVNVFGDEKEKVFFVEKSRDMMLSWLNVGLFTHAAMTTPGRLVLFQSQKLEKACELVEYARILYEQSDERIRRVYPLAKSVQASGELVFANGRPDLSDSGR